MPAQAADQYSSVLSYLRRVYWRPLSETWDVAELRKIAEDAFRAGTKGFVITSTSSEAGGAAASEITFDRLTLLSAVETLLAEADPTSAPPPRSSGFSVDFSQRASST